MKILGIIPARGGSKGVPMKNIFSICGKPMIYYTINQAKQSKYIDTLLVSTDNKQIFDISKNLDVQVLTRPENLSCDDTPIEPVVIHSLDFFKNQNQNFDLIIILQPTSPLRLVSDIDEAIEKFLNLEDPSKVLVSVSNVKHPPHWMFYDNNDNLESYLDEKKVYRRQDGPSLLSLNGAIYIFNKKILDDNLPILDHSLIPFAIPDDRSIDVDSLFDIKLVELLLQKS